MSHRASPSPSSSPGPQAARDSLKPINTRASLQPQAPTRNVSGHTPISPRPPGINTGLGRPTSELLTGSGGMFQTPEAEAIDQWFENLQNYETTLEEMAAASMDVNFKEELSAIEQWFRVLSEAERTAALYSLLQHSTQMQIRFFITVLQQMARSDPMTALLSPAIGASMQNQMDAKLASMGLKSPGLPPSPSARNFSGGPNVASHRQSISGDPSSSFLSPDSANVAPGNSGGSGDAAATLAHQRAKLKANAAHRISAPGTLISGESLRGVWPSSQLGQVSERAPSPSHETLSPPAVSSSFGSRPKSTDFTGVANAFRNPPTSAASRAVSLSMGGSGDGNALDEQLSPMVGGNWASMVNTPLVPMFGNDTNANSSSNAGATAGNNLDAAALKLANWTMSNNTNSRVVLDDARKFRRPSATKSDSGNSVNTIGNSAPGNSGANNNNNNAVYNDDGELVSNVPRGAGARNTNTAPSNNNLNPNNVNNAGPNGFLSPQAWNGNPGANPRSPALSNASSGRFPGAASDDAMGGMANFGGNGPMSPMGMNMNVPGMFFNGMPNMAGMNSMNGMGMQGMAGMGGLMTGMEGLQLNPLQQAQIFAAQLAASGYNPAAFGMAGQQMQGGGGGRSVRSGGGRSPNKATSSLNGKGGGGDKDTEEVDPSVLGDVPTWLRTLRLHKYTPNFEGLTWKDMVVMDEAALEAKGVAALGARRKMLKTFEAVRAKMGIEGPAGSAEGGDKGDGEAA